VNSVGWDVPRVAVDALLLHGGKLVLVRRGKEPYRGSFSLPGGFVEFGERLEDAVEREVLEETGLAAEVERLLGVYGNPKRDPRGHTISVAYVLRSYGGRLRAATDAAAVKVVPPTRVPKLAFDHDTIVADFLRSRRRASSTSPSRARGRTRGRRASRTAAGTGSTRERP